MSRDTVVRSSDWGDPTRPPGPEVTHSDSDNRNVKFWGAMILVALLFTYSVFAFKDGRNKIRNLETQLTVIESENGRLIPT